LDPVLRLFNPFHTLTMRFSKVIFFISQQLHVWQCCKTLRLYLTHVIWIKTIFA
jgi:hypothetical protein